MTKMDTDFAHRLVNEARSLRDAFHSPELARSLPVSELPVGAAVLMPVERYTPLHFLRVEMILVRAGKADSPRFLDEEIACVQRMLNDHPLL